MHTLAGGVGKTSRWELPSFIGVFCYSHVSEHWVASMTSQTAAAARHLVTREQKGNDVRESIITTNKLGQGTNYLGAALEGAMRMVGVHHTIAVHGDCVVLSGGGTDGQV